MSLSEGSNVPPQSSEGEGVEVVALRTALKIALQAASDAEQRLGTVDGERQRATMEWAAASMAQAEWDIELSHMRERLRLSEERVRELTDAIEAQRASRSWRLLQALLAPYRAVRRR